MRKILMAALAGALTAGAQQGTNQPGTKWTE